MFPVFATALVGLAVGAIGNAIMPAKDTGGRITSAVLGLCGASLVASIGWLQGWWNVGAPLGYVAGIAGSVVLLAVYRVFSSLEIGVEIK